MLLLQTGQLLYLRRGITRDIFQRDLRLILHLPFAGIRGIRFVHSNDSTALVRRVPRHVRLLLGYRSLQLLIYTGWKSSVALDVGVGDGR